MENTPPRRERWLVTRTVSFSAAHRLYRDDWSEQENQRAFGACANPFGHGHNYALSATVSGERDANTGMVVHFQTLKNALQEIAVAPLDHRHMNHDVPFLAGQLPTSENVLAALWDRLDGAFAGQPFRLVRLRLSSTEKNAVEYERLED